MQSLDFWRLLLLIGVDDAAVLAVILSGPSALGSIATFVWSQLLKRRAPHMNVTLRQRRRLSASARRQRCRIKQKLRARSTQRTVAIIAGRALSDGTTLKISRSMPPREIIENARLIHDQLEKFQKDAEASIDPTTTGTARSDAGAPAPGLK